MTCEVTVPDGTIYRSHYATGAGNWKRGLVTSAEVISGGQVRKKTTFEWEHDGAAGETFQTNPRVTETTVSDEVVSEVVEIENHVSLLVNIKTS